MVKYRNYEQETKNYSVEETYKNMLEQQTEAKVSQYYNKYWESNKKYNIWTIFEKLNDIIDESDPDTDMPQIIHAYQTAESISKKYMNESKTKINNFNIKNLFTTNEWNNLPQEYKSKYDTTLSSFYKNIKEWSWFPFIGLIHDLGKVMVLDEFGSLPQWFVVGDIFPIGLKLSNNFVFYDKNYHKNNSSLSKNIYEKKSGFINMTFSWGHDYYLYLVMKKNCSKLPDEALYLIRFHSFYSWHSPTNNERGYSEYADDFDWYMLPLLKAFQKSDLYSKTHKIPPIEELKESYKSIINKYFNDTDLYW